MYNLQPEFCWSAALFESLKSEPADAILKLIGEHKNDPRKEKIDLGVGVYRDEHGNTPILDVIKKAEHWLVGTQSSKAYLGSRGDVVYCDAIQDLVFGEHAASDRIATLQCPGGSGALRVAAELALRAKPNVRMWVSDPTWNNHVPLLGEAGISLADYPYYDRATNSILFDAMLETLSGAAAGDLVLLHGCCHNPTGMDLSVDQWDQVIELMVEKALIPFIDLAYQGFSDGLDEDAYGVRSMFARVPEMILTQSCSKNFGLYRDRVGALSIVARNDAEAGVSMSQALSIVRTMYSLPPDHGGAVVAHILNAAELRAEWHEELAGMRRRLTDMRKLLVEAFHTVAGSHDFSHIRRTAGMFCYLGISAEQVGRLKKERGVYLVDSSRINVCGVTANNVGYLAESIASVL